MSIAHILDLLELVLSINIGNITNISSPKV